MSTIIKFDDIKAGDTVTVGQTYKVVQVDAMDKSLYVSGKDGELRWTWPHDLSDEVVYTRKTPPLIPDDAEFVVWNLSGRDLLVWKDGDGYWTDSDEDEYPSTAQLIERIKEICARNETPVDVTVLDRRAK